MKHSLYKYFTNRKYAEDMLRGNMLFRTLSYFREYEDKDIRRDSGEGTSNYRPDEGLLINNLTQGTTFTLANTRFESAVDENDIYIFCASRWHSSEKVTKFGAVTAVEVSSIRKLCERINAALPTHAIFKGTSITYYSEKLPPGARWALPEQIATSKVETYRWQDEYRLIFSISDALAFEKINLRLVADEVPPFRSEATAASMLLEVGDLTDICEIHDFVPD